MIRELYQEITHEVCLNVTVGKVDSVRKKSITKSGCRVYENGCIGVAGCLGQPTEETWAEAVRALDRKVASPGPITGKTRHRDLREETMTPEEFLAKVQELLDILGKEYPDFVLSNKVRMTEIEERISNDAGLDYSAADRGYELSIVVKQVGSPNVFDTGLFQQGRAFDFDRWLAEARQVLSAHRNLLKMPEGKEQLFLVGVSGFLGAVYQALNGQRYQAGASLFQGKLGEKLFDERVTISGDYTGGESLFTTFFDAEGVTVEGDKVNFIENGVFKALQTDRKYAALLGTESTACAGGAYDDAPSLISRHLWVEPTGALAELTAGRDAIVINTASGGDWTDEGNFATPVQCAYLYRDGALVGRLPEFHMTVTLDELFGKHFVGSSSDKFQGERVLAFTGTVL